MIQKPKFGLEKIENKYEVYEGEEILVLTPSNNYLGVFDYNDNEFLYLKPSFIREDMPNEKGDNVIKGRLETKLPLMVHISSIEAVRPMRKGYIEELINALNSVKKLEKSKKPAS